MCVKNQDFVPFFVPFWWVAGKLAEISNPPHSANAEIMYSFSASARWRTYESYRKPIIFAGTDLGGNISHGILAGTLLTLRIILIDLSTTHVLTCYFSCEPDIDSRVNLMQLPCVGHHRLGLCHLVWPNSPCRLRYSWYFSNYKNTAVFGSRDGCEWYDMMLLPQTFFGGIKRLYFGASTCQICNTFVVFVI